MTEGRKIAAILVADVVGYSRLMGADEETTLARLRALRNELFKPTMEAHGGRLVNRAGDGAIVEFRSVVEAVRCAIDITRGLAERNAPLPAEERIQIRIGVHLGDVIETADGDLFGDAVNIAARLEGICAPGGICLSEDAWRQVRDKLPEPFVDLGERELKNIARPMRVYALAQAGAPSAPPALSEGTHYAYRYNYRAPVLDGRGQRRRRLDQRDDAAMRTPAIVTPLPVTPTSRADVAREVLKTVARLTEAAPGEAMNERTRGRKRRGVARAMKILEKVERIVNAATDETDAGGDTAARQRRDGEPRGPGD